MRGLIFSGDRKLAWLDIEDPSPGFGEVVVQMKASGMCGSDLHPYRAPHDHNLPLDRRVIAGHEPCGIVAAVGLGVSPDVARVGNRVMVNHYHGCTTCAHCRTGWPQLCKPATRIVYCVNAHGAHAPYMKVPASTLLRLHDDLSFEAGAAIACGTGTAWGALERVQLRGGETIAVYGQGPVGLSVTMLAAARGARVIAIDIDDQRLKLASEFGADITLNGSRCDTPAVIRELNGGRGVSIALETSGSTKAADEAILAVETWGKLCCVGLGSRVSFDMFSTFDRQLTIMTSYSMSMTGQMDCADFAVDRNLNLDRLFTHRWTLEQAEQAYAELDKQSSGKGVFLF
jgi:threonine dehydrogenase-like Zn-dependent dehydrogenase